MKKLALIMVFVLLMALFIAFNYLLWDRENSEKAMSDLQNANASNNASISAQNREIKSLGEENTALQSKIDQLENDQKLMRENLDKVSAEKDQANLTLNEKISMLNAMKQFVDTKPLQTPVKEWADALDAGKYDEAYELEYGSLDVQKRPMTLAQYSENLEKNLKRINLKSTELDTERGSDTGEIYLAATLEVTLADNADKTLATFKDGQNIRYFKLVYNSRTNTFEIAGIFS
jgi:cell division protein FtsB